MAASRAASGARRSARARGSGGNTRTPRTGRATKSDVAGLKAKASEADRLRQDAYEAGRAGTPYDESIFGGLEGGRQAYDVGVDEARTARRQATRDQIVSGAQRVPALRGPNWINDGAGFLLGVVLYALALNYVQGGPGQARGWLSAKFLNKPYQRTGSSSHAKAAATGAGAGGTKV